MKLEAQRVVPLLVRHARPAPTADLVYAYDATRGVNVVVGGKAIPVVDHPAGIALIKTVQVQTGEDQVRSGR